jgi:MFS family permease
VAASRLIRFWFAISDGCAVLLCGVACLGFAASTFLLFAGASPREAEELARMDLGSMMLVWAVAGLGGYLVLRRKVLGVLLVSALAVDAAITGAWGWAAAVLLFIVAVFLSPFALVLLQARRSLRERESSPN